MKIAYGLGKEIDAVRLYHTPGNTLIFYDVETTGTDRPENGIGRYKKDPFGERTIYDQVTQLSARKYIVGPDFSMNLVDSMNRYFKLTEHPSLEQNISDKITEITGITREKLDQYPTWAEQAEAIEAFFDEHIVVGHNSSSFDKKFMERMYKYAGTGRKFAPSAKMDTLLMSRLVFANAKSRKLSDLIKMLGLEYEVLKSGEFHDSSVDIIATYLLYEALRTKYIPEFERKIRNMPTPYIISCWPHGYRHEDKSVMVQTNLGKIELKEYQYEWTSEEVDLAAINLPDFEKNVLIHNGAESEKDLMKKVFSVRLKEA